LEEDTFGGGAFGCGAMGDASLVGGACEDCADSEGTFGDGGLRLKKGAFDDVTSLGTGCRSEI